MTVLILIPLTAENQLLKQFSLRQNLSTKSERFVSVRTHNEAGSYTEKINCTSKLRSKYGYCVRVCNGIKSD
jgi:CYTH domain-containing protein